MSVTSTYIYTVKVYIYSSQYRLWRQVAENHSLLTDKMVIFAIIIPFCSEKLALFSSRVYYVKYSIDSSLLDVFYYGTRET